MSDSKKEDSARGKKRRTRFITVWRRSFNRLSPGRARLETLLLFFSRMENDGGKKEGEKCQRRMPRKNASKTATLDFTPPRVK